MAIDIKEILRLMAQKDISDIHFKGIPFRPSGCTGP